MRNYAPEWEEGFWYAGIVYETPLYLGVVFKKVVFYTFRRTFILPEILNRWALDNENALLMDTIEMYKVLNKAQKKEKCSMQIISITN